MLFRSLSAVARAVGIPVLGIGGINASNASSVIAAGAAGVAVVSALMGAENPEAAARDILLRVQAARAERGDAPADRGKRGVR